jgi:hypothetical protein
MRTRPASNSRVASRTSYPELCETLRVLARYCGSTALALSTHPLATIVWRWRRDPAPFERILRRVVDERLQLVTNGASHWLDGSGAAVRLARGWRVTGRETFVSGSPLGDRLVTTAVTRRWLGSDRPGTPGGGAIRRPGNVGSRYTSYCIAPVAFRSFGLYSVDLFHREFSPMSDKTLLIRKAAARGMSTIVALGLAILLSGCIIVPAGPYYHPHHYWGY